MSTPEQSFTEFVQTNSAGLLRAGWLLTGNWASAEDLLQNALAAVWCKWGDVRDTAAGVSYTRVTMTRLFLHDRQRRWSGEIPTAELPESATADHTANHDTSDLLRAAMLALPEQQRAAVVLRYFLDLSEQQAAQELGCSVGTVKSNTSRGLARLRELPGLRETIMGRSA